MGRGAVGDHDGEYEVRAAGGVVWRRRSESDPSFEVLLVHRPRYDDWSFPKGKLDPGESFTDAAWREVVEETGFVCELGEELPSVTYRDHRGRSKIVRYWSMTVVSGVFEANEEVDACEWLAPAAAIDRLSYDHDVAVIDAFVASRSAD